MRAPDWRAVIGQALARYRLGDAAGAYELVRQARQKLPPSPYLTVMAGYFSLMVGKVGEAQKDLESAASQSSPAALLAGSLLAQMFVAQNRKEAALAQASQVLSQAPDSPLAHLTMGVVKLSLFDRAAAQSQFEKALALDPNLLEAYLYLGRLMLGGEYLDRAVKIANRALSIAPNDAEVLSLAGFVRLAHRDYSGAFKFFNRAVAANPYLGEPYIGLGIYHFRYREKDQALADMLTATLLDPRMSSYQSELGKSLYQVRAFDKSLEVYDYAKKLDPMDPTPYFYKGIALTDLNRPGEAVQEINKSIELNDNVAMFRSRSLLDQDRAVRNVSLAKAYQQLGLTEWGYSKAVTAVNYQSFRKFRPSLSEGFDYRVLSGLDPQIPTSGLLTATVGRGGPLPGAVPGQPEHLQQYTSGWDRIFRHLPRLIPPCLKCLTPVWWLVGGVGAGEGSKLIQDEQAYAYGGGPGYAAYGFGRYTDSKAENWPRIPRSTTLGPECAMLISRRTANGSPRCRAPLAGFMIMIDSKPITSAYRPPAGDVNAIKFTKSPSRLQIYELAYYHRFNPNAASLVYYARTQFPQNLLGLYG